MIMIMIIIIMIIIIIIIIIITVPYLNLVLNAAVKIALSTSCIV